jgi:predicted phage-related endonuclease
MTATTVTTGESVIILSNKALEAVSMLRKARELTETIKTLEAEAKAILNETLPEDSHGVDNHGTVVVSRKTGKNSGVNAQTLKAQYPAIYAEHYRETIYTRLVLPKA